MTTRMMEIDNGFEIAAAGIQLGEGNAGDGQAFSPPNFSLKRISSFSGGMGGFFSPDISGIGAFAWLTCNPTTKSVKASKNITSVTFSNATQRVSFTFGSPFRDFSSTSLENYTVIVNCKKTDGTTIDARVGAPIFRRNLTCQVITNTRAQALDVQAVLSVVCFQK